MHDFSDRISSSPSRPKALRRAAWLILPAAAVLAALAAMSGGGAPAPVSSAVASAPRLRLELALPTTSRALPDTPPMVAVSLPPRSVAAPAAPPATATVPATTSATSATSAPAPDASTKVPAPAPTPKTATENVIQRGHWVRAEVGRGDTLSALFSRHNLSQAALMELVATGKPVKPLTRLRPGDVVELRIDRKSLLEIRYPLDQLNTLRVWREADRWQTATDTKTLKAHPRFTGGTIQSSLYVAALKAGLDERLIMELATIFGWDIDFALDIRQGDRFSVTYEELFADGESIGTGKILAASFVNQGREFTAVRFTYPDGTGAYFAPGGRSMRKAFLRAPVDFRRISSKFRKERYHPVLGVKRPHRGVDYAAATGTPIQASGDGKVKFAGRKGGYGHTVILQHGGAYTTLYAHMSRIAPGMRSGKRIEQGQIIGYVGRSGTATGPHLHYEFRINGVHRNPLTVKLPKADPLPKKHMEAFRQQSAPLLAQLALYARSELAQAGN